MDKLQTFFETALQNQNALVVYRLPEAVTAVAIWGNCIGQEQFDAGFVFAPFVGEPLFLPLKKDNSYEFTIQVQDFPAVLKSKVETNSNQKQFEDLVEKAKAFMQTGQAQKIVGSRTEEWETTNYQVINWFYALCESYPKAMVYLWYAPESGVWMGATPERLFTLSQGKLHTMALAGTQWNQQQEPIVWGQKEIEEQAFVTRYIVEQLKPYSRDLKIGELHNAFAAQLIHIRTLIDAQLKTEFGWKQGVEALHPTPAVCGTPREVARDFLLQHEGYDRKYYAGYLGPVTSESEAELYVNLRCMEVEPERIRFYVGCGLTTASDPTLEWEETANKSQTLKKVLQ